MFAFFTSLLTSSPVLMAPKSFNTRNKGKFDKGQSSTLAQKRPTNARELPAQVRDNLLKFFSEKSVNELLASTKPNFRAFVDYLFDLEQRSSAHCKCCPHYKGDNNNKKSKAVAGNIELQTCFTCHKRSDKKAMAKCSPCGEWFHPACENEELRQWEDDQKFEFWNCEDCQGTIESPARTRLTVTASYPYTTVAN
ncbi:hypothetical protein FCM35_KLT11758 [Carex littledalei]|uniref:PHD-type domain-containing protein n=1 Tax=Carex littledalei TaxID=544730 RepID=A0A833QRS1_9POAL|nr:hypothetical protein FCM35_KLT11758 [Carex littledalei]